MQYIHKLKKGLGSVDIGICMRYVVYLTSNHEVLCFNI